MKEEVISIIVPVYNVEKYLDRCIKSIVNQTHSKLEIILIDDGSTDKSGEICDNWSKIDSRIKVIHQQNSGVSAARNAGLKNVHGKYIGFVDSDDYIKNDMYEFLYKNIIEKNVQIAICGTFYEKNGKISYNKIAEEEKILSKEDALLTLFGEGKYGAGMCDKLFDSKLFENLNFPTGIENGEEIILLYNIFKKARKIYYNNIPKYCYCYREKSATHTNKISYDFIEQTKKLLVMLNNEHFLYRTIINRYAIVLLYNYNKSIRYKLNQDKKRLEKELISIKKQIIYLELSKRKK